MNIANLVYKILEQRPDLRATDKKPEVIYNVYAKLGLLDENNAIPIESYREIAAQTIDRRNRDAKRKHDEQMPNCPCPTSCTTPWLDEKAKELENINHERYDGNHAYKPNRTQVATDDFEDWINEDRKDTQGSTEKRTSEELKGNNVWSRAHERPTIDHDDVSKKLDKLRKDFEHAQATGEPMAVALQKDTGDEQVSVVQLAKENGMQVT